MYYYNTFIAFYANYTFLKQSAKRVKNYARFCLTPLSFRRPLGA